LIEIPTSLVVSLSAKTLIPLSTSAYLIKDALRKLAAPPATPPIKAFTTRSFLPVAVLVIPYVKNLSVNPTATEEDAAAAYPFKISYYV
jgi:hypothetical protein